MRGKFYIITLDIGGQLDAFDYKKFHDSITTAKGVQSWWHHLDSTYILKVDFDITANNIAEYIYKINSNKKFFVCELNINNINGYLPKQAWDWIRDNNKRNIL